MLLKFKFYFKNLISRSKKLVNMCTVYIIYEQFTQGSFQNNMYSMLLKFPSFSNRLIFIFKKDSLPVIMRITMCRAKKKSAALGKTRTNLETVLGAKQSSQHCLRTMML